MVLFRASHVSPWCHTAAMCQSFTHRYTFSMWLVRHGTNYSLIRPLLCSQLCHHFPSLSQRRKTFHTAIAASDEQELGRFHRLLEDKWQDEHLWSQSSQLKSREPWVSATEGRRKTEQVDGALNVNLTGGPSSWKRWNILICRKSCCSAGLLVKGFSGIRSTLSYLAELTFQQKSLKCKS